MTLRRDNVKIEILATHPQFIHARVRNCNGRSNFLCTFIYASHQASRRRDLWSCLEDLSTGIEGPWLLTGDFNSIISRSEHTGGASLKRPCCKMFQDFLFNNGLRELGFVGPMFTWRRGNLSQRLDRAVYNEAWDSLAPLSSVRRLHRLKSDHRPLIISLDAIKKKRGHRPFRFLASWMLLEQ